MHLRLCRHAGFLHAGFMHVSLAATLLLGACGATPDPGWSGGIPRGKAAVVTLEHALTDPPRLIGMVNETHPGLQANVSSGEKSELRRSGIKSVPDTSMDALLERLQSQGFLDWSTPIEQVTPLAGFAIQSSGDRMLSAFDGRSGMAIQPWAGLGVAFVWAFGALAVGYLALRLRDV